VVLRPYHTTHGKQSQRGTNTERMIAAAIKDCIPFEISSGV
jgi:hypothetical protein